MPSAIIVNLNSSEPARLRKQRRRLRLLCPLLRLHIVLLLAHSPAVYGWCRTRWSCATLALSLEARRGVCVSAETVRRWLHALGWRWKRAKLAAKDNDPERTAKLAAIRLAVETLRPRQALLFVDELDIALLPKTGYQWMRKGTQTEVLTPGQNEKHYLAGGWNIRTGVIHYCFGERKTNVLFRHLLDTLQSRYPAHRSAAEKTEDPASKDFVEKR